MVWVMESYFAFLIRMTADIFRDFKRIWSLAVFQYKQSNKEMFLGRLWKLVTPFIHIGVYWLVFGVGLREGRPVEGVRYVVWLVCGITPWFCINSSVSKTSTSIYSKAGVLSRSNIPSYLLPISSVWSVFLNEAWTMLLMFIIIFANGCALTVTGFGLVYYLICELALLSAVGLIVSVLVMLARDFQVVIQLVMRLFFFVSPIIWQGSGNMPAAFQTFDRLSLIAYIVRGFRSSLLYDTWFFQDVPLMLNFWGTVLLLYLIGAALQRKMGKRILDFL